MKKVRQFAKGLTVVLGFDDGLGFYAPNPYDFEQPSCEGCLWNAIKLVIILIILLFVLSKFFDESRPINILIGHLEVIFGERRKAGSSHSKDPASLNKQKKCLITIADVILNGKEDQYGRFTTEAAGSERHVLY